jgi:hypothetical protein
MASFKASSFNQHLDLTCPSPPQKLQVSLDFFFLVLEEDSSDLEDGEKDFVYVEAWRETHQLEQNISSVYTMSFVLTFGGMSHKSLILRARKSI